MLENKLRKPVYTHSYKHELYIDIHTANPYFYDYDNIDDLISKIDVILKGEKVSYFVTCQFSEKYLESLQDNLIKNNAKSVQNTQLFNLHELQYAPCDLISKKLDLVPILIDTKDFVMRNVIKYLLSVKLNYKEYGFFEEEIDYPNRFYVAYNKNYKGIRITNSQLSSIFNEITSSDVKIAIKKVLWRVKFAIKNNSTRNTFEVYKILGCNCLTSDPELIAKLKDMLNSEENVRAFIEIMKLTPPMIYDKVK